MSLITLSPIEDAAKRRAVMDAINDYDLASSAAWSKLDALSSHTKFDGLEAHIDGIFERSDGAIEVVATAYVMLVYGRKKDRTTMSDSYPAKVLGHFETKNAFHIDDVSVNTTSFYE